MEIFNKMDILEVDVFSFPIFLKEGDVIKELMVLKVYNGLPAEFDNLKTDLKMKEIPYSIVRHKFSNTSALVISEEHLYEYEFKMFGVNPSTVATCISYAKRKINEAVFKTKGSWHDKELNFVTKSSCSSCKSCPMNITTIDGEMADNAGCLPSYSEAIKWFRETGKVWACHANHKKACGGLIIHAMDDGINIRVTEQTELITEFTTLEEIYNQKQNKHERLHQTPVE